VGRGGTRELKIAPKPYSDDKTPKKQNFMSFTTATILFAYSAKQEETSTKDVYSSSLSLFFMHPFWSLSLSTKHKQNSK